ncbi:MAG: polyprenyl synthetase family protein, partial [Candidatus Aenigmarchaeota archaeon]|nr:polyprenyl synthetase family protein [Candidatus Aenigmarchaeota archaeon]
MVDFKDILAKNKPIIWEEVQKYLPKEGTFGFADVVNEYPRRQGKYGRGVLILLSCEAFGGDPKKAVRTAAAMQLSEDWLLIHDDLVDDSEERRGKPALHRIYGKSYSMNAGDYLQSIQWEALIKNKDILDTKTTFRVLDEFARMLKITGEGQHYEAALFKKNAVPLEKLEYEHYYQIIYSKTCEYTINVPIRLGAIIAGADEQTLNKINEFGIPLGKGFQIKDDLLNLTGKDIGKQIGGDIFEGKRTLMLIHLVKHTTGEEHKKVLEIMTKPRAQKTREEVDYVIDLMK